MRSNCNHAVNTPIADGRVSDLLDATGCWLGMVRLFDLYGLLQALDAVICEAGCFLVAFSKDTHPVNRVYGKGRPRPGLPYRWADAPPILEISVDPKMGLPLKSYGYWFCGGLSPPATSRPGP